MKTLSDLRSLPVDEYLRILDIFFRTSTLTDDEYRTMEEWENSVYDMFLEQDKCT